MPYMHVHIEKDEMLEELSDDDLKQELIRRNAAAAAFDGGDFAHVQHLAECGLLSAARTEALDVVSKAIGRPIH